MIVVLALLALAAAAPARASSRRAGTATNPFRCTLQQAGFDATGPGRPRRPLLRRVRQAPPERDRARRRRLPRQGAGARRRRRRRSASTSSPTTGAARSCRRTAPPRPTSGTATTSSTRRAATAARGSTNFNVNGQTGDPARSPGSRRSTPSTSAPGRAASITRNNVEADPACAARADADPQLIYSSYATADHRWEGGRLSLCARRHREAITSARLPGDTERTVRQRLGPPVSVDRGFLRYCLRGGGRLMVGEMEDRSGELGESPDARVVLLVTTASDLATKGLVAGRPRSRGTTEVSAGAAPLHRRPHERAGATGTQRADRGRSPGARAVAGVYGRRCDPLEAGSALVVRSPAVAARCMR